MSITQNVLQNSESCCSNFDGQDLRYDRYESKLAYWVEGEVEAEWEKTTSHAQKETGQFEVETTAADAMLQAVTPLTMDNKSLASAGF